MGYESATNDWRQLFKIDNTSSNDYCMILKKNNSSTFASVGLGYDNADSGSKLYCDKGVDRFNMWVFEEVNMIQEWDEKLTIMLDECELLANDNKESAGYDSFTEKIDYYYNYDIIVVEDYQICIEGLKAAMRTFNLILKYEVLINEAESLLAGVGGAGSDALSASIADSKTFLSIARSDDELKAATDNFEFDLIKYKMLHATTAEPVDISKYIVNSTFDESTITTGWTTMGSWGSKSNTNDIMEAPNLETYRTSTSAPTYRYAQQTLAKMPNGKFVFQAAAWAADQNSSANDTVAYGNVELYANEKITPVYIYDYQNQATNNEDSVFAHGAIYQVEAFVIDSTITIGLRDNYSNSNWLGMDNAKLFYYGTEDLDINSMKELLLQKIAAADTLTNKKMQSLVLNALNTIIINANSVYDNAATTADDIFSASSALANGVNVALLSISDYKSLQVLLDSVNARKSNYESADGYANLLNAIAAAQSVYDTADADSDGVDAAKTALQQAEIDCLYTFPLPNNITSLMLVNPNFDNNTRDGWSCSLAPKAVNYHVAEYYQPASAFDFYQAVLNLKPGKYTLKAQGFERPNGGAGLTDYINATDSIATNLYAKTAREEYTQVFPSIFTVIAPDTIPNTTQLSDENYYANGMQSAEILFGLTHNDENGNQVPNYEMEINDIVIERGDTLFIGVKGQHVAGRAGEWILFDNFRLFCTELNASGIPNYESISDVKVRVLRGGVTVTTSKAQIVDVYSITGQKVKSVSINGSAFIDLPQGIFIVERQKVLIR